MEIEVTNGQGLIQILADGFANCIQIRSVAAVNWPDNHGSIGEYYAAANLPEEHKQVLSDELNSALNEGDESRALAQMNSFLNLFTSGSYTVTINLEVNAPHGIYDNGSEWEGFSCNFYPEEDDFLCTRPANSFDQVESFLKPQELRHMLFHKPRLDYGNTEAGRKFNRALDAFLERESYINVNIHELFLRALRAKGPENESWLKERFAALERNYKRNRQVNLAFGEDSRTGSLPTLRWERMVVRNFKDFEEWKEKLAKSPWAY